MFCTALILAARGAFAQVPFRYTVTDLGSPGGVECAPAGLNSQGLVVGGADTAQPGKGPENLTNLFVWQPRAEILNP